MSRASAWHRYLSNSCCRWCFPQESSARYAILLANTLARQVEMLVGSAENMSPKQVRLFRCRLFGSYFVFQWAQILLFLIFVEIPKLHLFQPVSIISTAAASLGFCFPLHIFVFHKCSGPLLRDKAINRVVSATIRGVFSYLSYSCLILWIICRCTFTGVCKPPQKCNTPKLYTPPYNMPPSYPLSLRLRKPFSSLPLKSWERGYSV